MEILLKLKDFLLGGGSLLFLITGLIQISPIQINPWSWIARQIGRTVNQELINKVDQIERDVNNLRDVSNEREASNCRTHILTFGDDLLHGIKHSQEHFNHILIYISKYENYCNEHPEYLNNVAKATIKYIKNTYQKCLENNDFL